VVLRPTKPVGFRDYGRGPDRGPIPATDVAFVSPPGLEVPPEPPIANEIPDGAFAHLDFLNQQYWVDGAFVAVTTVLGSDNLNFGIFVPDDYITTSGLGDTQSIGIHPMLLPGLLGLDFSIVIGLSTRTTGSPRIISVHAYNQLDGFFNECYMTYSLDVVGVEATGGAYVDCTSVAGFGHDVSTPVVPPQSTTSLGFTATTAGISATMKLGDFASLDGTPVTSSPINMIMLTINDAAQGTFIETLTVYSPAISDGALASLVAI
jgi:hypothetical protein